MNKTLTTDQMTTLLKTLTIFIENRDPFTIESIINEIKRNGDQLDGFYDDRGNCIVDEYYSEISYAIDTIINNLYKDWADDLQTVYVFRPGQTKTEPRDEYDEEEFIEDDVNVDKEGNKLPVDNPSGVYDDTKEDDEERAGGGWYKDQDGNWDWDRDAAESARYAEDMYEENVPNYSVNDHPTEYEFTVDKNKRIYFGKKFLVNTAEIDENRNVAVIGDNTDATRFYITELDNLWELTDNEYLVGEYELNRGSLRINVASILPDVEPGDTVYAQIHWPVMCTDDNLFYIVVYTK